MKFYAALIDYCLQDMRVVAGPFSDEYYAGHACVFLSKYIHEPWHDVMVGDWFALHTVQSPDRLPEDWLRLERGKKPKDYIEGLCGVLGPWKSRAAADQSRKRNLIDAAPGDKGLVARVHRIVQRHPRNGLATHVVLKA